MVDPSRLEQLVDGADAMLPDTVRDSVPERERRLALAEELSWSLEVAAADLGHAQGYRAMAPVDGARDEDYFDRQLVISDDLWVLAGPRFRAMDLELPFVGISGASRAVKESDLDGLREAARTGFAVFSPRYVALWSGLPAGAWPQTRADSRLLAGRLGEMRARSVPPQLSVSAVRDLSFYDAYVAIYDRHRTLRPEHRVQARPEPAAELAELIDGGTVWLVRVADQAAGIVAARPGVASGCRGCEVVELVLAPEFCGRGYGAALSTLLARAVQQPDEQWLFGTIHVDNRPAYRSALVAGRIDVGGEILADL